MYKRYILLTVCTALFTSLISCAYFSKIIHDLENKNEKLLNYTIGSSARECQYYIEQTNEGFIIDGKLYESKGE